MSLYRHVADRDELILPMMARFLAAEDHEFDLDILVEFGLQRILDGLEGMISGRRAEM